MGLITGDGSVGDWITTKDLPNINGISAATSITYNGYVYVMGGVDDTNVVKSVYYAKLNNHGSVGDWIKTTDLPHPNGIRGATSVTYNGYVYVMGGFNVTTPILKSVYYAKLNNNDGSVGDWIETTDLPNNNNRFSPTSVTYNGYVYIIGGPYLDTISNNFLGGDSVYYAKLNNNNGSVGDWIKTTDLPNTNGNIATSITHNGYVYVMGGFDGNFFKSVYYAKLNNDDGSLGDWKTTKDLPNPNGISGATSVTYNGYVYVMGGSNNTNVLKSVYYSKLNNDGSVGDWITTKDLPNTNGITRATSITYNGYVYVMGGGNSTNVLKSVYYAKLNFYELPDPAQPLIINPGIISFTYNPQEVA